MTKAVVFDLDGTLVHSLPDLAIALNRLLGEMGHRRVTEDEVRPMVGDGAATLVERALAAVADQAGPVPAGLVARFLALYEGAVADHTHPWPGVTEALAELAGAGWRMAVCTNKPYGPTLRILDALNLAGYFAAVVGGDSCATKKPDPAPVRAALAALGVERGRAVMVGDSPNDVAAGRGAGLPVVAVSFGYTRVPPAELGADRVIDRFADLPAALAEIALRFA